MDLMKSEGPWYLQAGQRNKTSHPLIPERLDAGFNSFIPIRLRAPYILENAT